MRQTTAALAMAVFAATLGLLGTARAADYPVRPRVVAAAPVSACGCRCGCLITTYVRHRQLEMTYGYNLDPRERDEPRYYWGRMRAYPRYQTVYPVQAMN